MSVGPTVFLSQLHPLPSPGDQVSSVVGSPGFPGAGGHDRGLFYFPSHIFTAPSGWAFS